jgi:hypothetical protein
MRRYAGCKITGPYCTHRLLWQTFALVRFSTQHEVKCPISSSTQHEFARRIMASSIIPNSIGLLCFSRSVKTGILGRNTWP